VEKLGDRDTRTQSELGTAGLGVLIEIGTSDQNQLYALIQIIVPVWFGVLRRSTICSRMRWIKLDYRCRAANFGGLLCSFHHHQSINGSNLVSFIKLRASLVKLL
jgi:hypothetical protein